MRFDQLNLHLSNIAIILDHGMLARQHNEAHSATACPEISQRKYLQNEQAKHKYFKTPTRCPFEKDLTGKTIYPRIIVRKESYLRETQLPVQSRRTA